MSNEELMQWSVYYERIESNVVTKQDIYLARIAFMLCGSKEAKLKDFIIHFEYNKEQKVLKLTGKQMAAVMCAALRIKI